MRRGPTPELTISLRESFKIGLGIAVLLLATFAAGSAPAAANAHAGSPIVEQIAFYRAPVGTAFATPMWVPTRRYFVLTLEPTGASIAGRLFTLNPTTKRLTDMMIRRDADCPEQSSEDAQVVHRDTIVFIRRCFGNLSRPADQFTGVYSLTLGSNVPSMWRPYYLPPLTRDLAVAPDGGLAIINDAAGFNMHLRWLGARRLSSPIPLPWQTADLVAWAPSGKWIAADGIPNTGGAAGPDVFDLPSNLYLLDSRARIRKVLLEKIHYVHPPAWSPDSQLVALAAKPDKKPEGIYIVDVASGGSRLLVPGHAFGSLAWMSGNSIAVTVGDRYSKVQRPGLRIYRFDRSRLF